MPGKDLLDQFHLIMKFLGAPPPSLGMQKIYTVHLFALPVPWKVVYPFASDAALDLLGKLLQWEPRGRLKVEDALSHHYFAQIRRKRSEAVCSEAYKLGKEEKEKTLVELRQLLEDEVERFRREREGRGKYEERRVSDERL